jgi:CDP-diacylglycerol--serine O-phosphatidyltransferase
MRKELRFLAPNTVTAANITAGFLAIIAAARGRFDLSVYLLVLAITLDVLDGTVARLLKATSKFGQEMDSFSDAISFGAAPALLVYLAMLHELGVLGVLVSLIYLLAGIYRLARFNLTSQIHEKEVKTTGAPIPIGASYLMATVLMRDQMSPLAAMIVTLSMAVLMVSQIHLPSLKGKNLVTFMLLVGIVNYFAVVLWPSWYTIGWWNIWNGCILLAASIQDRRKIEQHQPV